MSKFIDLLPLGLVLLLFWGARPARPIKSFNPAYLDILPCRSVRGFMALFVIMHHLSQQTESGALLQMFRLFGNLPVSVFFFLSGYGLMKKQLGNAEAHKEIPKIKIPLLLFPLFAALLICYFLMQLSYSLQITPGLILQYIIKGDPILVIYWYMLLIPVFYLVFYLACLLFPKRGSSIVLCMALFTLIFILLGNRLSLGQWWYNSCHLFTAGLAWAAFEGRILDFSKKYYWLCFFACGLIFLFVWQYFDRLYALWPVPEMRLIISLIRNLAFTLAFIFFTMKLRFGNPVLDKLGKVSLELYLLHPIFLMLFRCSALYMADDMLFCLCVIAGSVISALLLARPYKLLCRKYSNLFST